MRGRGLVKLQGEAEGVGQGLFGEVVAGGAQAASGDEDVGAALGDVHSGAEAFGVVPHHGVIVDVDAQGGQALGDHLGVGVGDAAQQQLGAHGDDLSGMRHGEDLPSPTPAPAASAAANAQRSEAFPQGELTSPEDEKGTGVPAGSESLRGVGGAAQQQLGADRDKLGSMRHWQRPPIANTDIGGGCRRKCAAQRSISAGRIDFARG